MPNNRSAYGITVVLPMIRGDALDDHFVILQSPFSNVPVPSTPEKVERDKTEQTESSSRSNSCGENVFPMTLIWMNNVE